MLIEAAPYSFLSPQQLLRMPLMMLPLALSSITDASNAFHRLTPVSLQPSLADFTEISPSAYFDLVSSSTLLHSIRLNTSTHPPSLPSMFRTLPSLGTPLLPSK